MRGAETFTESLFTMRCLDDFVPDNHPLRPVRNMVNLALKNSLFIPSETETSMLGFATRQARSSTQRSDSMRT